MDVQLIDYFGSDDRVVDAARVSFSKVAANYTDEENKKLIKYLAKHNHWSPFAHVVITMKEKVPIFVARQRFKHRIGFEYNEVSRRYVDDAPEFFTPTEWRGKPVNAKQGSSDTIIKRMYVKDPHSEELSWEGEVSYWYEDFLKAAEKLYSEMITAGIAPEQARMVLPQAAYTEYYCTGSLSAWARAYKLRVDFHAQKEIQELAAMWDSAISGISELKHSWETLKND